MFLFHIAFSLGLIALAAGIKLFSSLKRHDGSFIGKFLAVLIVISALISTVCTAYCGIDLFRNGFMQHHKPNLQHVMPTDDNTMKKNAEPAA